MNKEKFYYGTGCVYELTKWLIIGIIVLLLLNSFVATVFIVDGQSMDPNFSSGEVIIADRWQYLFALPRRGDAVTLKFPGDPDHKKYIKRIIGLPGEKVTIQNGQVFINDRELSESYLALGTHTETYNASSWTLGNDEYFLMGDNRANSSDSRIWGVAPRRDLIARAWVIVWPGSSFGLVPKYK